jgi:NAD(P)-dependent dehydrogenase (short-subunit alcohol dehydrogenase family)
MDKVVVITAAGKGMGAACAESFSKASYKVVLMSRSNDAVELAAKLGGIGIRGSVLEENDLQSLVDLAIETYGRVDVVVNNTGHPPKGQLLDLSVDDWQNGGDLVLMNVIKMAKIVTRIMKTQGGGSIINISTFAAFEPSLSFPISSVMRTALASYSKLYAQEYGAHNIRMNNILPGYIESYPVTEEIINQIPLARVGKVHEIGETAVFLASEGAAYITGENIKVDGGITKNI